MAIGDKHIVKSFDEELDKLRDLIARMGGLAEAQLAGSIKVLVDGDERLAAEIIDGDTKVDELEQAVNEQVIRLLALRAPVADDLRRAVTALKLAGTLERVADHAASNAKRSLVLLQMPRTPALSGLVRLNKVARASLREALDAYMADDAEKATAVWNSDEQIDDLYSGLFRELLTYMMEDPRHITASTHLLFMAKNLERVGDHATTIAEMTYFLVTGETIGGGRRKADTTAQVGAE